MNGKDIDGVIKFLIDNLYAQLSFIRVDDLIIFLSKSAMKKVLEYDGLPSDGVLSRMLGIEVREVCVKDDFVAVGVKGDWYINKLKEVLNKSRQQKKGVNNE